jgi:hypothetical protein
MTMTTTKPLEVQEDEWKAKMTTTFSQPSPGNATDASSDDDGMASLSTWEPGPYRKASMVEGTSGHSPTKEDLP